MACKASKALKARKATLVFHSSLACRANLIDAKYPSMTCAHPQLALVRGAAVAMTIDFCLPAARLLHVGPWKRPLHTRSDRASELYILAQHQGVGALEASNCHVQATTSVVLSYGLSLTAAP